jgi:hypothetical protein
VAASGNERTGGLVAAANCAMTRASIRSVLARWPSEAAKARTRAGLTTTTGKPAAAKLAATTVSNPPVASTATSCAQTGLSSSIKSSMPPASRL